MKHSKRQAFRWMAIVMLIAIGACALVACASELLRKEWGDIDVGLLVVGGAISAASFYMAYQCYRRRYVLTSRVASLILSLVVLAAAVEVFHRIIPWLTAALHYSHWSLLFVLPLALLGFVFPFYLANKSFAFCNPRLEALLTGDGNEETVTLKHHVENLN